ncbi:hypothetical protein BASA81_006658 [Batrachochytrium salamandrivorans]|nr:hypothetical protein BASA81_006658 [Batrachochytrium salamandrivorans]
MERRLSSDKSLPEGWASYWDPDKQRTYYYHSAAKRSTWKRPVLSTPTKRRLASTQDNIRAASSASSLLSLPSPSTSFGVWKKSFSPEHNREYFYNRATGESRWRSPSSVSTAASSAMATAAAEDEKDREEQLRQRLARSQAVVAQSKLALEQLEHTRAQLRIDREARVAQAKQNGEVSKIWALAMLFCLVQLLLQKL